MCGLVGLSVHRECKFGKVNRNVTGGADPAFQWQNPLPAAALRFEITKLNRSNRENRDGPTFWRAGGKVAKRPAFWRAGWQGGQAKIFLEVLFSVALFSSVLIFYIHPDC